MVVSFASSGAVKAARYVIVVLSLSIVREGALHHQYRTFRLNNCYHVFDQSLK
jgi:hypothetical protein